MGNANFTHSAGHRLLASVLAMVMTISSFAGATTVTSYAAVSESPDSPATVDQPTSGEFELTLAESENGSLLFVSDSEAKEMSVNSGDTIEIEIRPKMTYELDTLIAEYEESGVSRVIVPKENRLSFKMPDENVKMSAVFTDDGGHIATIDEATDISSVEDYILDNMNTDLVGKGKKLVPYDILDVRRTFAERDKMPNGNYTIDGLYSSEDSIKAFITQQSSCNMLYEVDESSEYMVAVIDMLKSGAEAPVDAAFAMNNDYGEVINDCIYDSETGLVYVPKSYRTVTDDNELVIFAVRSQFLYLTGDVDNMTTSVDVNVKSNVKGDVASSGTAEVDVLSNTVELKIAEDDKALTSVDDANLSVKINSVEIDSDSYAYDSETGSLIVAAKPATVQSVDVEIKKQPLFSTISAKLSNVFGLTADAAESFWALEDMTDFANNKDAALVFDSTPKVGSYSHNLSVVANSIVYSSTIYNDSDLVRDGDSLGFSYEAHGQYSYSPDHNNNPNDNMVLSILNGDSFKDGDVWAKGRIGNHVNGNEYRADIATQKVALADPTNNAEFQKQIRIYFQCAHITRFVNPNFYNDNLKNLGADKVTVRVLDVTAPDKDGYGKVVLGFLLHRLDGAQEGYGEYAFWYKIPKGSLTVYKKSTSGEVLQGAKFTLTGPNNYNVTKTTNTEGVAKFDNLPLGTYTLKETGFPTGYTYKTADVTTGISVSIASNNLNPTKTIENKEVNTEFGLIKATNSTALSNCVPANYSLGGAKYALVGPLTDSDINQIAASKSKINQAIKSKQTDFDGISDTLLQSYAGTVFTNNAIPISASDDVKILTTDNTGHCVIKNINVGRYALVELKASKGYERDTKIYDVKVEATKSTFKELGSSDSFANNSSETFIMINGLKKNYIKVFEPVTHDPMALKITKVNMDGSVKAIGNGTFKGASFTFYMFEDPNLSIQAVNTKNAKLKFTATTDANGILTLDATHIDNTWVKSHSSWFDDFGNFKMPVCTMYVVETEPSNGYAVLGAEAKVTNADGTTEFKNFGKSGFIFHVKEERTRGTYASVKYLFDAKVYEPINSGNFTVRKIDIDGSRKNPESQGDADLSAEFNVYNISNRAITFNGKSYRTVDKNLYGSISDDDVILKLALNEDNDYTANTETVIADLNGSDTGLPVGKYLVVESKAGFGYEKVSAFEWRLEITIAEDENGNITTTYERYHGASSSKPESDDNNIPNPVRRGGISVTKFDKDTKAKLEGAEFTIYNRSKGPVYARKLNQNPAIAHIKHRFEKDAEIATIVTNKDGVAAVYALGDWGSDSSEIDTQWLPIGTYEIVETKAPDGYNADWSKTFSITENNQVINFDIVPGEKESTDGLVVHKQGAVDEKIYGGVALDKIDKDLGLDNGAQGAGTLEGAQFTVTNVSGGKIVTKSGKEVANNGVVLTLTTDKNGHAASAKNDLPYGKYKVKETKAPTGYGVDTGVWDVVISKTGDVITVGYEVSDNQKAVEEPVNRYGFKINKVDKLTGKNRAQGDGSLAATFAVIVGDGEHEMKDVVVNGKTYKNGETCFTFKTSASGAYTSVADLLPYGYYTIKETKASVGYRNPGWSKTFDTIGLENGSIVDLTGYTIEEPPVEGGILIVKKDFDLESSEATFGTTLNGVKFNVVNKSKNSVYVPVNSDGIIDSKGTLKEVKSGEVIGTIVSKFDEESKQYTATTGEKVLPYGRYEVSEIATNGYYRLTDVTYSVSVTKDGTIVTTNTDGKSLAFQNPVVRGDLKFNKVVKGSNKPLQTAWRLEWIDTENNNKVIESHVIVTDADGVYDSSVIKHSENTNANDKLSKESIVKIADTAQCGTWFGKGEFGSDAKPNDSSRALPYGHYRITELKSDTNAGYNSSNIVKEFDINKDVVNVSELINIGTIENVRTTIDTVLTTSDNTHIQNVSKNTVLTDTVTYKNLDPDMTYTVTGYLMVKEDNIKLVDANNETVDATPITNYKPGVTSGSLELTYKFDSTGLKGKTVVSYVTFTLSNGMSVTTHKDINDEDQSVRFPKIATTAVSSETKDHDLPAYENVVISDTVTYTNLVPGKEYTLKGTLIDKTASTSSETVKLLDADGKEIVVTKKFTPKSADGTVVVDFTVDGSLLAGRKTVVFETLKEENKTLAVHTDINDEGQTVKTPEIKTTAKNAVTLDHMGSTIEDFKIIDTVVYKNLVVGKEYTLTGKLYDLTTKDFVKNNDKEVTATKIFKPTSEDGSVDVEFTFDATALKNHNIVVFEYLTRGGVAIAEHADANDADQTIYFPSIKTTANVAETGHEALAKEDITITDTVTYKNLTVGKEYTLNGVLMNKETGEAALDDNGAEIKASVKFTPKNANGTVDVVFKFKGVNVAGKTLVAFEELTNGKTVYATHTDINDSKQTVTFPKIGTNLTDKDTGIKEVSANGKHTLVDTITYSNVRVGTEYVIKGKIYDKDADKFISEVTTNFKPEKKNGTFDVDFDINTKGLDGHTLVAFEYISVKVDGKDFDTTLVAVHEDKDDLKQTVTIPKIGTTAKAATTIGKQGAVVTDMKIIDTVAYNNLVVGSEYVLTGTLMDKTTGEAVKNNDKNVTVSKSFKPQKSNDSINVEFKFDATGLNGHDIVVYEALAVKTSDKNINVANHKDIEDKGQTIYFPSIKTTANAVNTEHEALAKEDITITDTVAYTNLIVGKTYTMKGILMDKETGEAVLDDDGREIESSAEFTPENSDGSVDVVFEFKGVTLAGKNVVAFETLESEGFAFVTHSDINDEDQTVSFPKIGTRLSQKDTGYKEILADTDQELIDTIDYANAREDSTYMIKGELVDKETGNVVATAEKEFTPDDANGSTELAFKFNTKDLSGHTLVAFETIAVKKDGLKFEDTIVAVHKDINDEHQTVYIPAVHTTATNKLTGDHEGITDKDFVLTDRVYYQNLIPGQEYTVKGEAHVKSTGNAIKLADDTYEVSKTFVPEESEGYVDIEFTFDGSLLKGDEAVVFEKIYKGDVVIGIHADINDKEQTVQFPKVSTKAYYGDTNINEGVATSDVAVRDVVTYENFEVGKGYTIKGELIDKETGKVAVDANGDEIRAEVAMTPDEPDGQVTVEFNFDGSNMADKNLVVFETVYSNDVARTYHKDLTDEDQSVHFPTIRTTLTKDGTDVHSALASTRVVLVDTVKYTNLVKGRVYTVEGVLMNKKTGEKILDAEGKEITAETTFTAQDANGTVNVTFVFNGVNLAGESVVAFEYLYQNGTLVVTHADINDEDQTVTFPKIGTTAVDSETKTHMLKKGESVDVIDTVKYENLVPGQKYVVTGVLMDKESKKAVTNAVSVEFTPETANGTVDVKFTVKGVEGKTFVAFEELSIVDKDSKVVIAEHKDYNDEAQTVHGLSIGTTATAEDGKSKAVAPNEDTVIVDTVAYKNLVVGKEYTIKGKIVDKNGSVVKDADGKDAEVSFKFIPEKSDGTVEVKFHVNTKSLVPEGSKEDVKLVCFEYVYDGNVLIGSHEDLNDEAQTVVVKSIITYQTGIANYAGALAGASILTLALAVLAMFIYKKKAKNF